jgi:thiamine-monophosphate kinase
MGHLQMNQRRNPTAKSLGEHKIIQLIQEHLTSMPNMPVPFGDDVSAVNIDEKRVAVLKTDMLVAKTDVPDEMTLFQAARKALIMNISDFASKSVQPTAALVGLGLPAEFSQKNIEEVADGLNAGAQEYGAFIIGGDTSETSDLIISISLYGTAQKSTLMLRSGAKPGDVLAVTGFFGKSAAGLRLLLSECVTSKTAKALVDAVLMPKARLAEGLALGGCGAVSASMDSSDGLAWTLHELARLSNVGFELEMVPVAPEVKRFAELNSLDASELALYGGEEYELVLTVKPERWNAAVATVEAVGGQLLPIGKAIEEKRILLRTEDKLVPIEARGWEHFKSEV